MAETGDFDSLFAAEYPAVLRTVFLICRDAQHAQDVTQDAFVELLRHWGKVSHYDRPGAWVRKVAIRKLVKHRRREARRRAAEVSFRAGRTPRAGGRRPAPRSLRAATAATHGRRPLLLRGPAAPRGG